MGDPATTGSSDARGSARSGGKGSRTKIMKLFALLLFSLSNLYGVTCPSGTTHIQGVKTLPDLSLAYGTIVVKGPSSPSGSVLSSTVTITFGANGAYNFCLARGKYNANL